MVRTEVALVVGEVDVCEQVVHWLAVTVSWECLLKDPLELSVMGSRYKMSNLTPQARPQPQAKPPAKPPAKPQAKPQARPQIQVAANTVGQPTPGTHLSVYPVGR